MEINFCSFHVQDRRCGLRQFYVYCKSLKFAEDFSLLCLPLPEAGGDKEKSCNKFGSGVYIETGQGDMAEYIRGGNKDERRDQEVDCGGAGS